MRTRILGAVAVATVLILLIVPLTMRSSPGFAAGPSARAAGAFLVKFRNLSAPAIEALNRQFGVQTVGVLSRIGVHRLSVPTGWTADEMVAAYRGLADVEFAEPDFIAQIADTMPNDALFASQWGPNRIQLPAAWDLERGSTAITVAVVDTGVDWTHSDLQGRFVAGYNFVANTINTQDDHGHGTHVAGIIGALTNNAAGVAGADWQVTILPVKVLNESGLGSYSAVADGIVYAADHGVKVINLSLGGSSLSDTLRAAVDYAWGKGVLLACAAGNTSGAILYPGAYPNCTTVGATDQYDQRAWFSSYGPQMDLSAPGDGILSTVPTGTCALCDPVGYRLLSGTSMATPHVAGLAALLFSHIAEASNLQVDGQMKAYADDLGQLGWDESFGYGRINAYRALANPLTSPPPAPPLSAKIANPPAGTNLSGTIPVRINLSGGSLTYQLTVSVTGPNRSRTICSLTTDITSVTCYWDTRKGGPAGVYAIGVRARDAANPSASTGDSVTVTVVK